MRGVLKEAALVLVLNACILFYKYMATILECALNIDRSLSFFHPNKRIVSQPPPHDKGPYYYCSKSYGHRFRREGWHT